MVHVTGTLTLDINCPKSTRIPQMGTHLPRYTNDFSIACHERLQEAELMMMSIVRSTGTLLYGQT